MLLGGVSRNERPQHRGGEREGEGEGEEVHVSSHFWRGIKYLCLPTLAALADTWAEGVCAMRVSLIR